MLDFWRIKMEKNKLGELIQKHGKRIKPNELMQQRAKNNVRAHWQNSIANNRKQRNSRLYSLAASLFVVFTLGMVFKNYFNQGPQDIFSNQQYVQGEVLVSTDGENWAKQSSKVIKNGSWLKTNTKSFTNLSLLDGSELRINHNSIVEIINPTKINLISGEIYHDADIVTAKNHLIIQTAFGKVQHIGTRYLVKTDSNKLEIAVRNGLVEIEYKQLKRKVDAGYGLTINDNSEITTQLVPANDKVWDWVSLAATPYQSEGKTLYDFVSWYAHEYGYKVEWNSNKMKSKRVELSGQISHLDKSIQLKAVFLSTTYDYQINKGILSIH